jgi:hypothetical protein
MNPLRPIRENPVKSVSAAIILIAGIACYYISTLFARGDSTATFVVIAGTVICGIALIGWFRTLGNPP